MTNKTFTSFFILFLISIITYGQENKLSVSEPVMIDKKYNLYDAGDVFLAGQPTKKNLDSLINAGVTLVINLRTAGEMTLVNYNEANYLDSIGIKYVHIPMGGIIGYPPEDIEKRFGQIASIDNHTCALWLYANGLKNENTSSLLSRVMLRCGPLIVVKSFSNI